MSIEQNKSIVLEYVDAFNACDMEKLRRLFAEDAVIQGVLGKGMMDVVEPIWRELNDSLACHLQVEEMIAEGDCVAVRYTETGTFQAPFRGHHPTGRDYKLVAMEWFTIKNGRIVSRYGARDFASQKEQIGIQG